MVLTMTSGFASCPVSSLISFVSSRVLAGLAACGSIVLWASVAEAQLQDLGHRLPGGAGLDAGSQSDQGLYVGDRFVWFASGRVKDRSGAALPIRGVDIDAFGNVIGIAGTIE